MKTKDICKQYGLNLYDFDHYLYEHDIPYKQGITGLTLADDLDISQIVMGFMEETQAKKNAEEQEKREIEEEEQRKKKALAEMLITSGFTFDGYRIVRYSGYISGDDAISISRGTQGLFTSATNVSQSLTDSLVKIRRQALKELKEAAYDLGCNAVIGVDFDYITLEPETALSGGGTAYLPYVFCVTANGNAVVIEKIE